MDNEAQQEGPPTAQKQAFIYKKNPIKVAKAITRKLRQSTVPTNDPLQTTSKQEEARTSQNEADTIATQGQNSHISPRGQAQSQGNFNRFESEVIVAADKPRPLDNRRFHTSHRANASPVRGKNTAYYEDNIDSETEVFLDPQFESKLDGTHHTVTESRSQQIARQLFARESNSFNNQTAKKQHTQSQDDHFMAIEAVINSSHDERTKQRLIADIQRKQRSGLGRSERPIKPRTQKQFKDGEPDLETRPSRLRNDNMEGPEDSHDDDKGLRTGNQQKTAKTTGKKSRHPRDDNVVNHQKFLMPEMSEFIEDEQHKRNYLTQDETYDSRLAQLGHNKNRGQRKQSESANESQDDSLKMKNFTPGRIRASRMGLSNMQEFPSKRQNYVTSDAGGVGERETQGKKKKNRANTRQPEVNVSQQDFEDSIHSKNGDYKELLPAVKVRQKKKKHRSPSDSKSRDRNNSTGLENTRHSVSRLSTHVREKKLKATLDQGIHFVPANIGIPVKQTKFYDNAHSSGITDQQLKNWQSSSGQVILDAFNAKNKGVPVNRHRVPNVVEPIKEKSAQNRSPADPKSYVWDMDGRRHKKPKKSQQIKANAVFNAVDLPQIKSGQRGIFSPDQTRVVDQKRSGRLPGAKPNSSQTGKFIDYKKRKSNPHKLHSPQDSESVPQLVDIGIKPKRNPKAKIHEPPITDENENQPDYDCPVCKKRVLGRDTAKHSRACRTHACRFCNVEQPIAELDQHETNCTGQGSCPFCKVKFPKDEFLVHEEKGCPSAGTCRHCKIVLPKEQLPSHEDACGRGDPCRFCRKEFKLTQLASHEQSCPEATSCPFCLTFIAAQDSNYHLQRCPEARACQFCGDLFHRDHIDDHCSGKCPEATKCRQCKAWVPKSSCEVHMIKECPKATPELGPNTDVDPTNYIEMRERNLKKLNKKKSTRVIVEDEFIEPNDFRDPGGRKSGSKSNDKTSTNSKGLKFDKDKDPRPPRTQQNNKVKRLNSNSPQTNNSKPPLSRDRISQDKSQSSPFAGSGKRSQGKTFSPPSNKKAAPFKSEDVFQAKLDQPFNNESNENSNDEVIQGGPSSGKDPSNFIIPLKSHGIKSEEDLQVEDGQLFMSGIGTTSNDEIKSNTNVKVVSKIGHDYGDDLSNHVSRLSNQVSRLNKIKSQQAASQVKITQDTNEMLLDSQNKIMNSQVLQVSLKNQKLDSRYTIDSQEATCNQNTASVQAEGRLAQELLTSAVTLQTHQAQMQSVNITRVKTTEEGRKKSTPSSKKRILRKNTEVRSGGSNASNVGKSMYFPDRQQSSHGSKNSGSPEAKRVMEKLTHHRVKIDEKTQLLINGREVLTQKGIKGTINSVGVGFGTGRHTSGRRMDLYKNVPQSTSPVRKIPSPLREFEGSPHNSDMSPPGIRYNSQECQSQSPVHRRRLVTVDTAMQHKEDVQSEGCDPIPYSIRSAQMQAYVSQQEINLSARTMTAPPDRISHGVSAKQISVASVREQADQVSDGRFAPVMVNTQVNTDWRLLDDYLRKPMCDSSVNTQPILFGLPKPQTCTAQMQTEPMINEAGIPEEPEPAVIAHMPVTAQANLETGSNGSLLDLPTTDEVCQVPEWPESSSSEEEEYYVDDWIETELYKYSFEMHYDKLVKKKLIIATEVKRPEVPENQKGMSHQQRFEYNLNPEGFSILSQIECEYGQAALRHKTASYCNEEMLLDLYTRAKKTIEVLVANMVRPDIANSILFAHYQEVTKKNVIKLLIRVKKLYEARNESVNILKLVMEVEAHLQPKSMVWRVLQNNDRTPMTEGQKELIKLTLKIISNALTRITIFQQEQRLFKEAFKFNKKVYRDYLRDLGMIIGGFLKMKSEPNPALQETGLLKEDHGEHSEQSKRYNEWVAASLNEYGKLDVPKEEDIKQILAPEKPDKKVKGSRIDRALEKLREEQALKSETNSQMEISSRSKILAQMQMKSDQLNIIQQNSGQVLEDWQASGISDQMLERIQASASKKDKIAKANEERIKRHEDGYQTPDSNEKRKNKDFPGKALLLQQLNYDREMESIMTENAFEIDQLDLDRGSHPLINSQSVLLGPNSVHGDSIESSATNIRLYQKNNKVLVSNLYEDYQQKSQFEDSHSVAVSLGNTYDSPSKVVNKGGQKRNANHQKMQSQVQISSRQFEREQQMESPFENEGYVPQIKTAFFGSIAASPSERTVAILPNNSQQRISPTIKVDEVMENVTEFTEQFDDESQKIGLESDKSVEQIGDSEQEEDTVIGGGSIDGTDCDDNSGLRTLNQGQIKIKYAASSHQASELPDSMNDRH